MPRLKLKTLHSLYQLVSERREGPNTIKVKSLNIPLKVWLFSPEKLAEYRVYAASLLSQLPADMFQSAGKGGLPWFSAIRLSDGQTWGDLYDADKLLAIGRALSMVRTHRPRTDCDVSFCIILDDDIRYREHNLPPEKQNRSLLYWRFYTDNP